MAKLVNNRARAEYYIVVNPAPIGRDGSNAIRLPGSAISRFHAEIGTENGGFYIEDVGSTFGTYVNGRLVEGRTRLEDGDRIKLGVSSARPDGEWDLTFSTEDVPEDVAAYMRDKLAKRRTVQGGTIIFEQVGRALVGRPIGNFRGPECDKMLEKVLSRAGAGPYDVVLDLETVTYMNSYGLGVLGKLWMNLRELDLEIVLVSASGKVLELLEMVGLWSRMGCRGLLGDALKTLHVRRLARQG